jgi:hypothetical protein
LPSGETAGFAGGVLCAFCKDVRLADALAWHRDVASWIVLLMRNVTLAGFGTRCRADKRQHRDNRDSHFNTSL